MKHPDAILAAIPATYLLAAAVLWTLDASVRDAVLVASLTTAAILAQALFVSPPE
ncbi:MULTISPECIES: hypothetical protein [Halorussus]|uniref:hypothetical protein n=1 Tax=Halorussus TaxID=1070314 RepID=UPI0020A167DF|nr:hypothetical protein [Halorussus vallis]USZ74478.1 hypothetical protein NGM07_13610 [Halorussus vallis]